MNTKFTKSFATTIIEMESSWVKGGRVRLFETFWALKPLFCWCPQKLARFQMELCRTNLAKSDRYNRAIIVETLFDDPIMSVCGKKALEGTRLQFEHVPKRPASNKELVRFLLILPEPDARLRRRLDRAFSESDLFGKLDIVLEVGGWSATLDFVRDGRRVGIVTKSAITSDTGQLSSHQLEIPETQLSAVRFIARTQSIAGQPDLCDEATRMLALMRGSIAGKS